MKNIVLIGMMGCGKSTIGALLSEKLGRKLVDTDALIVEREGRSIPEIFAAEGEEYFRERDRPGPRARGPEPDLTSAGGGGLPLRPGGSAPLKKRGVVFWLRRDPGETYDTMDTALRPLAQQGREDFLARFAQREPIYQAWADHMIVDFSSPEKTCKAILEVLK